MAAYYSFSGSKKRLKLLPTGSGIQKSFIVSEPQGHWGGPSVPEMTAIAMTSLLRKRLFGTFKYLIIVCSVCLTRLCCLICYISWNMKFEMSITLHLEWEKWIQSFLPWQLPISPHWLQNGTRSGRVSMFMFSNLEVSFNRFLKLQCIFFNVFLQ